MGVFASSSVPDCKVRVNGVWVNGYSAGKNGNMIKVNCLNTTQEFDPNDKNYFIWAKDEKKPDSLSSRAPLFKEYDYILSLYDERAIISRIGRIEGTYKDDQENVTEKYASTGTVLHCDNNQSVFVITSAFNLFSSAIKKDKTQLEFVRLEGNKVTRYPCKIFAVHKDIQYEHDDPNDLVILEFKDKNNYYQNLFSKEQQFEKKMTTIHEENKCDCTWHKIKTVDLYSSDKINCDFHVSFKVFACDSNEKNKLVLKELISRCNEDDGNSNVDEKKNVSDETKPKEYYLGKINNNQQFKYNGIIPPGQIRREYIGAALIIEVTGGPVSKIQGGKYGIIGIYTGEHMAQSNEHDPDEFFSVAIALNNDKYEWIEEQIMRK